jgi:hypothetical protein
MADAAPRRCRIAWDQHDLVVLLGAVREEDQLAAFHRAAVENATVADDETQHLGIEFLHRGLVAGADLEMADGVAHRAPPDLLL